MWRSRLRCYNRRSFAHREPHVRTKTEGRDVCPSIRIDGFTQMTGHSRGRDNERLAETSFNGFLFPDCIVLEFGLAFRTPLVVEVYCKRLSQ